MLKTHVNVHAVELYLFPSVVLHNFQYCPLLNYTTFNLNYYGLKPTKYFSDWYVKSSLIKSELLHVWMRYCKFLVWCFIQIYTLTEYREKKMQHVISLTEGKRKLFNTFLYFIRQYFYLFVRHSVRQSFVATYV